MENKIPIYDALITNLSEGIDVISIVDDPAVESNFMAFNKQKELTFSIQNEDERMVLGVIMRANFNIYRRDPDGFEYYIRYSPETIKKMSEKMFKDNTYKNISLMHNGHNIKGVELIQMFIKNSEKGINPQGFENIADGSLFAQYHILDDELWQEIKNGTFKGFSLEGYFTVEKTNLQKQNKSKNMLEKIKSALKKVLVEFGSQETVEGVTLFYEGETLEVDVEVADENGNAVPDGVYHFDEKEITIENSKIVDIKEIEKEESKVEETVVEEVMEEIEKEETVEETVVEDKPKEDDTIKEDVEQLKKDIEDIKKEIEDLKELLTKPATETVVEEFSKVYKPTISSKSWLKK